MKHNLLIEVDCGEETCHRNCKWAVRGRCIGFGEGLMRRGLGNYVRLPACHAAEAAAKAPDLEPWRELAREVAQAATWSEVDGVQVLARRLLGKP